MPERIEKSQNAALKMQSRNPTGLITEIGKLFFKSRCIPRTTINLRVVICFRKSILFFFLKRVVFVDRYCILLSAKAFSYGQTYTVSYIHFQKLFVIKLIIFL